MNEEIDRMRSHHREIRDAITALSRALQRAGMKPLSGIELASHDDTDRIIALFAAETGAVQYPREPHQPMETMIVGVKVHGPLARL